jgi:hypothetical protein
MSGCDRVIEVEDLVLGLVASDDLEAHVESCADCTDAREMFQAERALFAARVVTAPEPPPLVLPKPVTARVYRFVPALAAACACFVFFIGRPHADDCEEPAPSKTVVVASDEPAICRAPSESPAPAETLASHDPNACVPSPNATCDVTSSTAMP